MTASGTGAPSHRVVDRYREVRPGGLREAARGAWLSLAGSVLRALPAHRRALARPRVQILNFHHVFPDELAGFAALLAWLRDTGHTLVGYDEAVRRVREGPVDIPAVAFTFDDGLRRTLDAARMLAEAGAPACWFVNTAILDEEDPARLASFARERLGMPPVAFLSWADLEALRTMGHLVGGHTHGHPRLSDLTEDALREEVHRNRELLEARVGPVRHFAWPYGGPRDVTPGALRMVREAGYESAASGVRGCHLVPDPEEAFRVRRDHLWPAEPLTHVRFFLHRSVARGDLRG